VGREDGAAGGVTFAVKEPVDARISFAGLFAAVAGIVFLAIRFHGDLPVLAAMVVYGASLCVLFGASSLYHGVPASPAWTTVLRKIDHAAIYVLIAGTYTPVLFVGLDGAWRISTLGSIWGVAIAGVVLTIWFVHAPRWLSATVYIAMGWFAIVPAFKLVPTLPHVVTLLVALGGLLYTLGALVYATRRLDLLPRRFGFHEVFHLFVLAGAATQFVAIAGFLVRS
jgi:hemolysin III